MLFTNCLPRCGKGINPPTSRMGCSALDIPQSMRRKDTEFKLTGYTDVDSGMVTL